MDRDLFLRVIPWQCLGSVWSRRGSGSDIHTVKATVRQFNKVVYLVLSTVLSPCLSMQQRSGIVQKWIQIAQESMKLKNYSSLRAIVSGLQTHGIHRLKKTWSNVGNDYISQLAEAQAISKESNHADDSIPYLGHVLTDLMMVDAAYPDRLEDSGRLINFEKRRKEFELLKLIASMQSTLHTSDEKPKARLSASFVTWISFIQPLTESQSFELSQMVESKTIEQDIKPHGNVLEHSFSALLHEPEKFEEHLSDSDIEDVEDTMQVWVRISFDFTGTKFTLVSP